MPQVRKDLTRRPRTTFSSIVACDSLPNGQIPRQENIFRRLSFISNENSMSQGQSLLTGKLARVLKYLLDGLHDFSLAVGC